MKIKYGLIVAALTLVTGMASAGFVQPAEVEVDLVNMFAFGDQHTARNAKNDVEFIGCGIRLFDDGINQFTFGFCQAGDSAEVQITCFTQNANLLDTMKATSDFAFITFSWRDDGFGGAECTRIGFSTQSFYLPKFSKKSKKSKRSKK